MRYPVDRTSDDGLQTTIWGFELSVPNSFSSPVLRLWQYASGTRKTRRHKWVWNRFYERLGRNNLEISIRAEQVPLPDDVKAEALQLVMQSITIEV